MRKNMKAAGVAVPRQKRKCAAGDARDGDAAAGGDAVADADAATTAPAIARAVARPPTSGAEAATINQEAAAKLLVSRIVDIDYGDGYGECAATIMDVNDKSENNEGDDDLYMLVRFEDGWEESYTVPILLNALRPWEQLSLEQLEQLRVPVLNEQLGALRVKGRSQWKTQKAKALGLYHALHPEEADGDAATELPDTDAPEENGEVDEGVHEAGAAEQSEGLRYEHKMGQKTVMRKLEAGLEDVSSRLCKLDAVITTMEALPGWAAAKARRAAAADAADAAAAVGTASAQMDTAAEAVAPAATMVADGRESDEVQLHAVTALTRLAIQTHGVLHDVVDQLRRMATKMLNYMLRDQRGLLSISAGRFYVDSNVSAAEMKALDAYVVREVNCHDAHSAAGTGERCCS